VTTTRRRYTRKQKAEIVGLAEVEGVREAARQADVPVSTLEHWRQHGEMAQLRTQKREEVAADIWAVFQKGVRRVEALLPTTEDMAKVAVATGILYDKFALMSGQATTRNEHRELTGMLDDHEREALRKVIDDVLAENPVT
jgi:transposase-like protein